MFRQASILLCLAASVLASKGVCIIGGENAAEGELPYQIHILLASFNLTYCGGALLEVNNRQFILTTATCVNSFNDPEQMERVKFVAGDLKASEDSGMEQLRLANRFIVHPDYNYTTKTGDLAIVGYETPFNYSDAVRPIGLPQQGQNTTGTVLISGWGGLSDETSDDADNLQKLRIGVISDEECENRYQGSSFAPVPEHLCAQSEVEGINAHCYGDRGGPVVSVEGGYLVGLLTYPESCMTQPNGYPDVYTEIAHYVEWIVSRANDL